MNGVSKWNIHFGTPLLLSCNSVAYGGCVPLLATYPSIHTLVPASCGSRRGVCRD